MVAPASSSCKTPYLRADSAPVGAPGWRGPPTCALGTIPPLPRRLTRRRSALSSADPNYDAATDTYRQIYRGHDNASAVTNSEGLTVYFDPDTHDVLGFSIAAFSAYYESHKTAGRRVRGQPAGQGAGASLEEEMDFDAEAIRSGVRIAEFY